MNGWMSFVRILIGLVAAVGLAALITNTIATGRDIPAGLLTLLMSVVGAVYGIEAVSSRREKDD